MFTCLKCGKKIKTLYERVFGEKPHYEPKGYCCETCRIFYDADTRQVSRMVSGVAKAKNDVGGLQTLAAKSVHEPHANAAQNACESDQERMQKPELVNAGSSSSNSMKASGWGEI